MKQELKKFERMVRVFEMTYLDMTQRLQEITKENNLKSEPKEVQQDFKINQKGQVISHDQQFFDQDANLIDREARMVKHSISKSKNPNQRIGRKKQVISLAAHKNRNESNSGGRDGSGFNLSLSPATRVVMEGDTFQQSNKLASIQQKHTANNNSQWTFKSEMTRKTNGTNSNNESTLYGSSGIGQPLKENSFNLASLQNSHAISQNQTGNKLPPSLHQLSTDSGKRKKIKTIDVQGDKENGGRRSLGAGKQAGQKNAQNLFQNSVSIQNEHNKSV